VGGEKIAQVSASIFSGRGKYAINSHHGVIPLYGANGIIGYVNHADYEGCCVLTGRVGTLGNVFLVCGKIALSDNVLAIIPKLIILTFYIYLWLKKL